MTMQVLRYIDAITDVSKIIFGFSYIALSGLCCLEQILTMFPSSPSYSYFVILYVTL